jgi:hypothetical protein
LQCCTEELRDVHEPPIIGDTWLNHLSNNLSDVLGFGTLKVDDSIFAERFSFANDFHIGLPDDEIAAVG